MKSAIPAKLILAIALAALPAIPAPGQSPPKAAEPTAADHELAAITARGTVLAAYDQAVQHATSEVMLVQPNKAKIERYVARQTTTGWTVDFGRLNADGTKFLTAYEAIQSDAPNHFAVGQFDPEREDTGFNLVAARAIDVALHDFGSFSQPYAVAVLPAGKQILVYFYPAQTKEGVYPYGGDVRYLLSGDGKTISTKWQMHKTIAESILPPPPAATATPSTEPEPTQPAGAEPATGQAAASATPAAPTQIPAPPAPPPQSHADDAQSTLPEDTDVMLVLRRQPRIPEYVTAGNHTYRINTDGTITPDPTDIPLPH